MKKPSVSFPEKPIDDFSVQGALRSAEQGRRETWIRAYLDASSDFHIDLDIAHEYHKRLAVWFGREERFWAGPLELPLDRLTRQYGPEETMPWKEAREQWESRVTALQNAFAHPLDMPPMIARAVEEEHGASGFRLLINDGAHRHEALKRLGETTGWVLVWFDSAVQQRAFVADLDRR